METEITATEAAAIKGVSRVTINNAIRSGRLPARAVLQPGSLHGRWIVKQSDLDAWEPLTASAAGVRSGEIRRMRRDQAANGEN